MKQDPGMPLESTAAGEGGGAFSIRSLVKNGAALEMRFDTSPDTTYAIETSPSIETPVWSTLSFSTTPAGAATETSVHGTGGPAAIYVAPDGPRRFHRLVKTP